MWPKVHASARKYFGRDRLSDEAILYAYEHALNSRPLVGVDTGGAIHAHRPAAPEPLRSGRGPQMRLADTA